MKGIPRFDDGSKNAAFGDDFGGDGGRKLIHRLAQPRSYGHGQVCASLPHLPHGHNSPLSYFKGWKMKDNLLLLVS
jgi:hypothetical protein